MDSKNQSKRKAAGAQPAAALADATHASAAATDTVAADASVADTQTRVARAPLSQVQRARRAAKRVVELAQSKTEERGATAKQTRTQNAEAQRHLSAAEIVRAARAAAARYQTDSQTQQQTSAAASVEQVEDSVAQPQRKEEAKRQPEQLRPDPLMLEALLEPEVAPSSPVLEIVSPAENDAADSLETAGDSLEDAGDFQEGAGDSLESDAAIASAAASSATAPEPAAAESAVVEPATEPAVVEPATELPATEPAAVDLPADTAGPGRDLDTPEITVIEYFDPPAETPTQPGTQLQRVATPAQQLTAVLADRGGGALIGAACGDVLGVPYEFVSPRITGVPHMLGGGLGPYAPGEWSDDTQLMICIAEIAANGLDLTSEEALNAIAQRYLAWFKGGASDIDSQTRLVLESIDAETLGEPLATRYYARKLRRSAVYFHRRTRRAAGNALLPRMAVVGLTRVEDREWTAAAAREITMLTHVDDLACDASVLWAEAVRRAVTDPIIGSDRWAERIHIEDGLDLIPSERRDEWADWLAQARAEYFAPPGDNTFVVATLQAAIGTITQVQLAAQERIDEVAATAVAASDTNTDAAITVAPSQDATESASRRVENAAVRGFVEAMNAAVRVGGDTDTVAATVGALMGAACGANAIPQRWARAIFGWPGMNSNDLRDLGAATTIAGIVGEQKMQKLLASENGLQTFLDAAESGHQDSAKLSE